MPKWKKGDKGGLPVQQEADFKLQKWRQILSLLKWRIEEKNWESLRISTWKVWRKTGGLPRWMEGGRERGSSAVFFHLLFLRCSEDRAGPSAALVIWEGSGVPYGKAEGVWGVEGGPCSRAQGKPREERGVSRVDAHRAPARKTSHHNRHRQTPPTAHATTATHTHLERAVQHRVAERVVGDRTVHVQPCLKS